MVPRVSIPIKISAPPPRVRDRKKGRGKRRRQSSKTLFEFKIIKQRVGNSARIKFVRQIVPSSGCRTILLTIL